MKKFMAEDGHLGIWEQLDGSQLQYSSLFCIFSLLRCLRAVARQVSHSLLLFNTFLLNQVVTQLSSRGWVDPVPDLIHIITYRIWIKNKLRNNFHKILINTHLYPHLTITFPGSLLLENLSHPYPTLQSQHQSILSPNMLTTNALDLCANSKVLGLMLFAQEKLVRCFRSGWTVSISSVTYQTLTY